MTPKLCYLIILFLALNLSFSKTTKQTTNCYWSEMFCFQKRMYIFAKICTGIRRLPGRLAQVIVKLFSQSRTTRERDMDSNTLFIEDGRITLIFIRYTD